MNETDLQDLQLAEICLAANKCQTCYRRVTWNAKGLKTPLFPLEAKNLSALHRTETRLAVLHRGVYFGETQFNPQAHSLFTRVVKLQRRK